MYGCIHINQMPNYNRHLYIIKIGFMLLRQAVLIRRATERKVISTFRYGWLGWATAFEYIRFDIQIFFLQFSFLFSCNILRIPMMQKIRRVKMTMEKWKQRQRLAGLSEFKKQKILICETTRHIWNDFALFELLLCGVIIFQTYNDFVNRFSFHINSHRI